MELVPKAFCHHHPKPGGDIEIGTADLRFREEKESTSDALSNVRQALDGDLHCKKILGTGRLHGLAVSIKSSAKPNRGSAKPVWRFVPCPLVPVGACW